MVDGVDRSAVLFTGVYGAGKSSVALELADILERRGVPFAALDLDWLTWFQGVDDDGTEGQRVLLANLRAVVGNYLDAGVARFILAGSVHTTAEIDAIRATIPAPLTVVRLTVPLAEIERRLEPDVTAGRRDDLRQTAAWLADGVGVGVEDVTVDNDRPIREVALEVICRLDWD